jgi:hypothetical protein
MNLLKVSLQQSIIALAALNWSQRRIARELQLDRGTVAKYLRPELAKPASNPALGSDPAAESKPASNPAHGSHPGPASLCQPLATEIGAAVQAGLSAQRIYPPRDN